MKRVLLWLLTGFLAFDTYGQQRFQLYAPDSSLHLEINLSGKISYRLFSGGDLLVAGDSIDLLLADGQRLSNRATVSKKQFTAVRETVEATLPYRRKKLHNHYNQLQLQFRRPFSIEFRLYNNGMAYRIGTRFPDSIRVAEESAPFDIDTSARMLYGHLTPRNDADRFHTSFEAQYGWDRLGAVADTSFSFAPITLLLPNGYQLAVSDANLFDYPGMFLQRSATGLKGLFAPLPLEKKRVGTEFPQDIVTRRAPELAHTSGQRFFP